MRTGYTAVKIGTVLRSQVAPPETALELDLSALPPQHSRPALPCATVLAHYLLPALAHPSCRCALSLGRLLSPACAPTTTYFAHLLPHPYRWSDPSPRVYRVAGRRTHQVFEPPKTHRQRNYWFHKKWQLWTPKVPRNPCASS